MIRLEQQAISLRCFTETSKWRGAGKPGKSDLMEAIKIFLLEVCYEILSSLVVRFIFEKIGANKRLHLWLRRLSGRLKRESSALTKKELTSLKVVEIADSSVISESIKNQIVDSVNEYGCISRKKEMDAVYYTPLSIDLEKLFLALAQVLTLEVVPLLNSIYDNYRIACIVVLPSPGNSKSRMTANFQIALSKCLSGLEVPVVTFPRAGASEEVMLEQIANTKANERILILQPSPLNDHGQYLTHILSLIEKYSMSEVAEILTLVDPINQPKNENTTLPRERVLLKLNLDN